MEKPIAKWVRAAFIPAVGLTLSWPALSAGESPATPHKSATAQSAQKHTYRGARASQLIGKDVKSPQGKNLGSIEDLIVDMNSGEVRYSILKFDPGIFTGEKLFAVPTSELKQGKNRNELVYNMSRERLEKAGVERGRWPGALRDRDYLAGLDRAYGIVQPSKDRRAFSAAELLGKDVNGRTGKDIGEIRDLVIDMNGQRVHYAVLAFDPSWTAPEKLFAFPVSAFTFTEGKDELALDVDKARLQAMRSFDQRLWTGYSDSAFVTDVDRYLITITPVTTTERKQTTAAASGAGGEKAGSVQTTSPQYGASMKRLQDAAQKLRESIQAMAQEPVGERRNRAIKEAHEALYDTNQAMIQLPPELRAEPKPQQGRTFGSTGTTVSPAAGGAAGSSGATTTQTDYSRSMELLQKSAQKLRESIQAMAQQPAGPRRDQAIKEAHQALFDTNQAMVQLPPDMRMKQ